MDKVNFVMFISFITNIFLAIFKIVFGVLGTSGALIADGIHSFSDMMTDLFAVAGNVISKKPADLEHPFGHGNAEYLTCLVIGITIFIMGVNVIVEGVTKDSMVPSLYVAVISLITIFIKLLLSRYILKNGRLYDNNILISSGSESFTDVISSLIVLVSVLLSKLSDINRIFSYSDKVAMIIVGALIIRVAIAILRENLSNLLGKQVLDKQYINYISDIIVHHDGIIGIDSLIIIKFGSFKKIDCEVGMNENMSLKEVHKIIDHIEKEVCEKDTSVSNIIIHVNPYRK